VDIGLRIKDKGLRLWKLGKEDEKQESGDWE